MAGAIFDFCAVYTIFKNITPRDVIGNDYYMNEITKRKLNSTQTIIDNLPKLDLHGYDRQTAIVAINDFINDNIKLGYYDTLKILKN